VTAGSDLGTGIEFIFYAVFYPEFRLGRYCKKCHFSAKAIFIYAGKACFGNRFNKAAMKTNIITNPA
ncbi:hypothetical protein ACV1D9_14305, partial [Aeromonas allosaccharophila]